MFRHVQVLIFVATIVGLQALAPQTQAQLTHRWNFSSNTNDSVGGINGTLNGGASVSGGQLVLDGVDDFMSLPSSPLPSGNGQSATFEIWGTYATNTPAGSRIFDFSDGAQHYLYLTPNSTVNTPTMTPSTSPETRFRYDDTFGEFGIRSAGGSNTGSHVLLTAVVDFPSNLLSIYRNGGLVTTTPMLTTAGVDFFRDLAGANSFRFGHGQSVSSQTMPDLPGFLSGSINEFRIYNNPLSAAQILTNAIAGPDTPSVVFTDKLWNPGTSNWNTGGNWTAAGVPGNTHRAVITNGGTAMVSAASPNVGAIQITNGALTIASGGSLESVYPIQLAPSAGNTATINVNSSNALTMSGIVTDVGEGNKVINIDGGTIKAGFSNSVVQQGIAVNVGAAGATIDTQANTMAWTTSANVATPTLGLAGSGTVTKTGSGRLNLYTTTPADRDVQSPSFTGEFHINQGTVDIAGNSGVFGRAGTRGFGKVIMNNSTLLVNTASGESREFGADLNIVGDNVISNENGAVRELRMQSSLSGNGTLRFRKPNVAAASGLDFEIFDLVAFPNVTNVGFTGRIVIEGNFATRFRSGVANSPIDFPTAVFEIADTGAWVGKRGPDGDLTTLQSIIELGGVESVGGVEDPANPGTFFFPRLESCIAGCNVTTNPLMTYQIGGASQNAEFRGIIQDTINSTSPTTTNETVRVVKVGDNTQIFSGPNTYSGATSINGGKLLVNGTHQMHATSLLPVGDYTVNTDGTLGGTGTIGSATDAVNVTVLSGTLGPGASTGTLTLNGNYSQDANSKLAIEIGGNLGSGIFDVANISGTASLAGVLDVSILGSPTLNIGDTYTVLSASGGVSGTLSLAGSAASAFFDLTVTSNSVMLEYLGGGVVNGDFDNDGDVDGRDFLIWQRGGSSNPLSSGDLAAWQTNYGSSGPLASVSVPEPNTFVFLFAGLAFLPSRRRSDT